MYTKKIKAMIASAILLVSGSAMAQTNLGASCGCPTPVSTRPTVNLSTLATVGGANDGNLIGNVILDCSKTWILDKKIYVASGNTLTIQPGTVIKANTAALAADAVALTVSVGGKIIAAGTPDCQIVFTSINDPMDGSYGIGNIGGWGGICIAGKATNNLTLAANGPFTVGVNGKICVADGLGTFEGFASTNSKDQFGVNLTAGGVFDDNDNSGILRYVSIRHTGAVLVQGGELNALSLGSVGRGTTIENIEIMSGADDGVELWGGTVNLKNIAVLFGNDDDLDWDCGWKGNAQFIFGLKTPSTTASPDADNGIEADADDQKSNNLPRSRPVIYNATFIGRDKGVKTTDNTALAGINAKEYTEGEIYNSVFANFRNGFNVVKSVGTRTGGFEAYGNWSSTAGNGTTSLKVKCNTFANDTAVFRAMSIDASMPSTTTGNPTYTAMTTADSTQFFTTDLNTETSSIPGFTYNWSVNPTTNAVATQFDAVPNPALSTSGCPTPPVDGFFKPAAYRGAFDPNGTNWLSSWAFTQILNVTAGLQSCPTDLNGDRITKVEDFLILLGQFNSSCN